MRQLIQKISNFQQPRKLVAVRLGGAELDKSRAEPFIQQWNFSVSNVTDSNLALVWIRRCHGITVENATPSFWSSQNPETMKLDIVVLLFYQI